MELEYDLFKEIMSIVLSFHIFVLVVLSCCWSKDNNMLHNTPLYIQHHRLVWLIIEMNVQNQTQIGQFLHVPQAVVCPGDMCVWIQLCHHQRGSNALWILLLFIDHWCIWNKKVFNSFWVKDTWSLGCLNILIHFSVTNISCAIGVSHFLSSSSSSTSSSLMTNLFFWAPLLIWGRGWHGLNSLCYS